MNLRLYSDAEVWSESPPLPPIPFRSLTRCDTGKETFGEIRRLLDDFEVTVIGRHRPISRNAKLDIPQVWQSLTQGQGTVIAALITLIAALGGVVLGWLLFSGRVRSLETALSATESNVRSHLDRVEVR